MEKKNLVIFGNSEFAEIAFEYFSLSDNYRVVAFCVHRDYLKSEIFLNLPLVPFEDIELYFSPRTHWFFAACVYTRLNRLRTQVYLDAKAKGFELASYISPHAFVSENAKLGEHVFIFENVVIQPGVQIGNNVVIWSGGLISHHSVISDNVFIAPGVAISGGVHLGDSCFVGIGATIIHATKVGRDCFLASRSHVVSNIPEDSFVKGRRPTGASARAFFGI